MLILDPMVARMRGRISHTPYITMKQKEWLQRVIDYLADKQIQGLKTLRLCHGDYHSHKVKLSVQARTLCRPFYDL